MKRLLARGRKTSALIVMLTIVPLFTTALWRVILAKKITCDYCLKPAKYVAKKRRPDSTIVTHYACDIHVKIFNMGWIKKPL